MPATTDAAILGSVGNSTDIRIVARNRRARYDYEILDRIEAGISLMGSEVKSLRAGKINMGDSYATIERGSVILKNLHISPYEMAADQPLDPIRPRQLLLHKREIRKMRIQVEQRGMTLVALSVYFKGKVAKVELGVAKGRRKYDKRQAIAKKEADRRIKRATQKDM
ncbi:MAG: SsrA-binding protein SmpB [Candidatus Zixiibacteriota bacterium]